MDVRDKMVELIKDGIRKGLRARGDERLDYSFEDVADHLISNGVTVQEWIPVEERLPERNGPVLTSYGFSEGGEISDMRFFSVMRYYAVDPKPHFHHEGYRGLTVTHWMPLPQPPKGE